MNKNSKSTKSTTAKVTTPKIVVEHGEFKGKPTITLKRDAADQWGFTFGVTKARLICEAFKQIQEFAYESPA